MTVSTTAAKVSYAGDGTSKAFITLFPFLSASDLVVVLRAADGTETTKILTTDYTVVGGAGGSGTVTFATAPAVGETVVILRVLPLTQETDYTNQDPFNAETHERALDRAVMRDQQLAEALERAVTTPLTSSLSDIRLPEPGAGDLLRWNAAGTALETVSFGSLTATDFDYTPGSLADNDMLVYEDGADAWINKTPAQVRTVLGLGALSLLATVDTDAIDDGAVTLAKLESGTQGDILYYGGAGAAARLAAGTAGQLLKTNGPGADPSWSDGPVLTKSFESGEIAITNGTTGTVAHGLGMVPKSVRSVIRCKSAELGYSVGDEIEFSQAHHNTDFGSPTRFGVTLAADASNVRHVIASNGIVVMRATGSVGQHASITNGNWRLVIYALA